MATTETPDRYAMGRSEAEERRLQRQAQFYTPATRQLFAQAGIGPGMRVLDLGSGAGDVAMLAAELVGPTGQVVGVDTNGAILATARRRARAAGLENVTFVEDDLRTFADALPFDAVVGRLVLCHLRDPAAALRHAVSQLRSDGVAAFYELDCSVPGEAYPPSPLTTRVYDWIGRALAFGGVETAMGMKMDRVFRAAGLAAPRYQVDAQMGGERAFVTEFTSYMTDTLRSVLPLVVDAGLATAEEVGVDTLAARWRDELLRGGSVIRAYLFMGAWARKATGG
jgi:ubiquinone/menaquinone biosynthesis C-methylase UbiE